MLARQFIMKSLFFVSLTSFAQADTYDLVIYGGTSAGVIAAVQAKQMGKTTVIVCPEKHLGGLSAGGLGWTDTGNKGVIGGLARNFYHRIWVKYQDDTNWKQQPREAYGNKGQGTSAIDGTQRTMWIFEPHIAEEVFEDYVREYEIPVYRDEWLNRETGVKTSAGRITSITTLKGNTYTGKMFIDATYEGDLMAAAGVDFHVGREANSVYGEQWNGVQVGVLHHAHYFKKPTSPYVVPDDPNSGVLPRISTEDPGQKGEGDHRVQAYCYRMCLTNHAENRVPFPKPEGYDRNQYALLLRVLKDGWREGFQKFDPIPNHKTDTNNHGPFSTDNIGYNYEYPEGSYEKRQEILDEHIVYQKGLMYFLANDPEVPEDVRKKFSEWGLAADEFVDNGNWPHQIYVREARRMIGPYVMTEQDCLSQRQTPESVGMGSYTMDSHNVQRYITPEGYVQNEGDIGVSTRRPYQISYRSLVPQKDQAQNLLVPVCLSSSHIAFGSIRMEPVFMILAQSAATAAVMAIDQEIPVQEIRYDELQARLLKDGQVLDYDGPTHAGKPGVDPKSLKGLVLDDGQAKVSSGWGASSSIHQYVGVAYLHDGDDAKGERTAVYSFSIQEAGKYALRVSYSANANRATNVPVVLTHGDRTETYKVNQRKPPGEDGFVTLGEIVVKQGDALTVTISNAETDGYVIADAVQLLPQE